MQEESDLHCCYEKQRLPKIWIIEKWTDCLRKIFLARNLDLEKSQAECIWLTVRHAFRDGMIPTVRGASQYFMTLQSTAWFTRVHGLQSTIFKDSFPHSSPLRRLHQGTIPENSWKHERSTRLIVRENGTILLIRQILKTCIRFNLEKKIIGE